MPNSNLKLILFGSFFLLILAPIGIETSFLYNEFVGLNNIFNFFRLTIPILIMLYFFLNIFPQKLMLLMFLNIISKLNSKYLYFIRTTLTQNKSVEFKQISLLSDNGPCKLENEKKMLIEYKNKIINKERFENIFKSKYKIFSKCIDQKNAFFYGNNSFNTYTYILKREKN
jgi:hypothetical protein